MKTLLVTTMKVHLFALVIMVIVEMESNVPVSLFFFVCGIVYQNSLCI